MRIDINITSYFICHQTDVLLDGQRVQGCLWADDQTGEACAFMFTSSDKLVIGSTGEAETEILKGKVELINRARNLPWTQEEFEQYSKDYPRTLKGNKV